MVILLSGLLALAAYRIVTDAIYKMKLENHAKALYEQNQLMKAALLDAKQKVLAITNHLEKTGVIAPGQFDGPAETEQPRVVKTEGNVIHVDFKSRKKTEPTIH